LSDSAFRMPAEACLMPRPASRVSSHVVWRKRAPVMRMLPNEPIRITKAH